MSSPFYGLMPVSLPFSGTTDANGNFSITLRPRAAFWVTGKIVGKVTSGFPAWEVTDGVIPIGVGNGPRAEIAGIAVPPGASIIVNVVAAQPNVAVTGRFVGVQGPTMESAASAFVAAPNTISASINAPQVLLGSLSVPGDNGVHNQSFILPAGTHDVAVGGTAFAGLLVSLTIVGDQSGLNYLSISGALAANLVGGIFRAQILSSLDSSVTVSATKSSGLTITLSVVAILDPTVVQVVPQVDALPVKGVTGGQALTVDVNDRLLRQLGRAVLVDTGNTPVPTEARGLDVVVNNLNPVFVQEGASPPLWQAPRQIVRSEVAVVGNSTLLAGVGGQTIRVWGWELETDQGTGFSIAFLNDTGFGAGTRLAALTANNGMISGNMGGAPLPLGTGLGLEVAAIATGGNVRAYASVSQG